MKYQICITNILWRVSQAVYCNTNRIVTKCIVTPLDENKTKLELNVNNSGQIVSSMDPCPAMNSIPIFSVFDCGLFAMVVSEGSWFPVWDDGLMNGMLNIPSSRGPLASRGQGSSAVWQIMIPAWYGIQAAGYGRHGTDKIHLVFNTQGAAVVWDTLSAILNVSWSVKMSSKSLILKNDLKI